MPFKDYPKPTFVRKVVKLRSVSDDVHELCGALITLQSKTMSEPGCRQFDFYQSVVDPKEILLIEEFDDTTAFQRHLLEPYTKYFFSLGITQHVQSIDIQDYWFDKNSA